MNDEQVVIGLFSYASDARRALHVLHEHHFASDQVTAAFRETGSARPTAAEGVGAGWWFGQLRQLYRGDERVQPGTPQVGTHFQTMLQQIDLSHEDAAAIDDDLSRGAAIVTVRGTRAQEAQALLQAAGARIVHGQDPSPASPSRLLNNHETDRAPDRVNDHEKDRVNGRVNDYVNNIAHSTPFHSPEPAEPGHIQLFGEVLRVHKEKVSSGEVRVRKESVTHMETVQVPITREHLVVEHSAGGGSDTEEALRIPLSEERVHIAKETVLREEYKVGKREVTQNETVTDTVRRDRLLIDDATRGAND